MENHLAYNAYIKPTKLGEDAMQFVCTTKSLSRNLTPLTDMTTGKGKVKMIDTSEWEWKLYGVIVDPIIDIIDLNQYYNNLEENLINKFIKYKKF